MLPVRVDAVHCSRSQFSVHDQPAVPSERADLPGPTPRFRGFDPSVAHQDFGAIDLVQGVVGRLVLDPDGLALTTDDQGNLLLFETCPRHDAGNLQDRRRALVAVGLVEQGLLLRFHICGDAVDVLRLEGYLVLFCTGVNADRSRHNIPWPHGIWPLERRQQ